MQDFSRFAERTTIVSLSLMLVFGIVGTLMIFTSSLTSVPKGPSSKTIPSDVEHGRPQTQRAQNASRDDAAALASRQSSALSVNGSAADLQLTGDTDGGHFGPASLTRETDERVALQNQVKELESRLFEFERTMAREDIRRIESQMGDLRQQMSTIARHLESNANLRRPSADSTETMARIMRQLDELSQRPRMQHDQAEQWSKLFQLLDRMQSQTAVTAFRDGSPECEAARHNSSIERMPPAPNSLPRFELPEFDVPPDSIPFGAPPADDGDKESGGVETAPRRIQFSQYQRFHSDCCLQ